MTEQQYKKKKETVFTQINRLLQRFSENKRSGKRFINLMPSCVSPAKNSKILLPILVRNKCSKT